MSALNDSLRLGTAFIEAPEIGIDILKAISVGPNFFNKLPSDPEALAGMAKRGDGITIIFMLAGARNCVKRKYGPFQQERLFRRLDDWRDDRTAFIKKYSPKLSAAMQLFEKDYAVYKAETEREYAAKCLALPKPPAGFYWKPDDWGLDIDFPMPGEDARCVRLWHDAFGPMPVCGAIRK